MKNIIIIIFFVFGVLTSVFAQSSGSVGTTNSRATAMGKTYVASSQGLFSVGVNPANLMNIYDHKYELATVLPFPNLNLGVGTNFINIEDYNYFFGGVENSSGETVGRYLNESDKQRLKEIFEGGGLVWSDFSTSLFSISYKANEKVGAFAIGIYDVAAFKMNIPEDVVDLALYGNPLGSVYNFDDASLKGWWLRNYSLSYARNLNFAEDVFQKISAGITLKYVQGFAYAGTEHVNSSITTDANNFEISAQGNVLAYSSFSPDFNVKYDFDSTSEKEDADPGLFPKPAGSGFGFDLGFSAVMDDIWTFGLAVTDIGSIKWTENVARFTSNSAVYLRDITDEEELDSLKESITGEGEFWNEFSTSLPTALRMGAAFKLDKYLDGNFPGEMLIAFDYNQGFNNQPGNTKTPRFSLGAEWKPAKWIPIRTGFSFGGLHKFRWTFGFGFDTGLLEFNFASPDFQYLFMPNGAKRVLETGS